MPTKVLIMATRQSFRAAIEAKLQRRLAGPETSAARHAEPLSVNKSPNAYSGSATFDSVENCKQKPDGIDYEKHQR